MKDFKEMIRKGETPFILWCVSAHPSVVEIMGYAGFDFVFIDTEHAGLSPVGLELENCVRAAYAADIAPFTRLLWNDPGYIKRALNLGIKGILSPHINTAEDAALLVKAGRYAPEGRRSVAPVIRAAKHGWIDWPTYYKRANEEIALLALIEEKEAVENIEEIMAVEGLDGMQYGPVDLGVTLELPGTADDIANHPMVWEMLERVIRACKDNNKIAGNFVWTMESAKRSLEMGCDFVSYSTDVTLVNAALRSLGEQVRRELGIPVGGRL